MQLSKEQIDKDLTGLNAGDALIGLQLITRLLQVGAIKETELATVGVFRNRLTDSLNRATGINYDEVLLAEAQAAQATQKVPAPAAPVEVATS